MSGDLIHPIRGVQSTARGAGNSGSLGTAGWLQVCLGRRRRAVDNVSTSCWQPFVERRSLEAVARYLVTFSIDARDRADAEHWAAWLRDFETIMREVTVELVERAPTKIFDKEERQPARLGES